jgi:hypothetical protein
MTESLSLPMQNNPSIVRTRSAANLNINLNPIAEGRRIKNKNTSKSKSSGHLSVRTAPPSAYRSE